MGESDKTALVASNEMLTPITEKCAKFYGGRSGMSFFFGFIDVCKWVVVWIPLLYERLLIGRIPLISCDKHTYKTGSLPQYKRSSLRSGRFR